ncbi:hypothetical protein IMZ48_22560 [Candidatus Bathyarchaeota archaeon]|nr:hypothetical protein [Candidatus Bathyarchaeota archaeon]
MDNLDAPHDLRGHGRGNCSVNPEQHLNAYRNQSRLRVELAEVIQT